MLFIKIINKIMRKFRFLLGTCIAGIVALTTSAFAYFNFSSNSTTNTSANAKSSDYVNNIKFDNNSTEDSERVYTLYFFASPYYACGLESETISANTDALNGLTDPLTIANSSDNPYIDSTSYCITSKTALSDSEDKRYSNFQDSDGNYRYISTPSYDPSDENYDGSKLTTIESTHTKADFYGSLEIDGEVLSDNNNELVTHTDSNGNSHEVYFKIQVTDSIKSDVLRGITASTVFKNRLGFGPEFMGWTYDKQECFKRVTYSAWDSSYHRYYKNANLGAYTDLQMTSVTTDSNGNVTLNYDDPDQIGNFGANSFIDIFSSDDSLYGIDNNAKDGSGANNKKIYLYPVFGDRTISTSTSVDKTPILKMLSNPDTNETKTITTTDSDGNITTTTIDNPTYYKYHQEGENDYSIGDNETSFHTTERKATFLTYKSSVDVGAGVTVTEPNYTLKNFYVNQEKDTEDSFLNNYYLEALTVDNDSYSSSWKELFNNSNLIDLFSDSTKKSYFETYVNNYEGTFDIDIIFSQNKFTFSAFINDELYINNPTQYSKTFDDGITVYYVIGLKRNNSLKLIPSKNDVINYTSKDANYFTKTDKIYEENDKSSYWHYFTCKPFSVDLVNDTLTTDEKQNGRLYSIMLKESLTFCVEDGANKIKFKYITTNVLKAFNDYVSNSDLKNKVNFLPAKSSSDVTISASTIEAMDGSTADTTSVSNFPTIRVKKSGTYEILAAVKYSDGFPTEIDIGFREYNEVCNLLVLSEKPTSAIDTSGNYVYSTIASNYNSSILLEGEFSIGSSIDRDTKFGSTKFSTVLNNSTYSSKELYDLATGKKVKDLITSGNFVLSRNMILYYGE